MYMSKIAAIGKTDVLNSNIKRAFNYLKQAFIIALIF